MLKICTIVGLRILSNSFLNTEQKRISKNISSININFKTYFILTIFCLPIFFILYFNNISHNAILWAFIGGIFGAAGNACLIYALEYGELSVLGPINSYKAIVSLVFGIFLLNEFPNLWMLFGMMLIIFGSWFIFSDTKEGFTLNLFKRKDVRFRILALVLTAIEAVFIKKVIILSDALCSFLLWVIFGCLFSYIILKFAKKKVFCNHHNNFSFKEEIGQFIILSTLVLIMQLSTNLVFCILPVSIALSLFQLSNILNVFLGYKIFNEKHFLKKLAGSIIMVIGSIFIILCKK